MFCPIDGAIKDIEGSKQRRAVPFIVMRHCAGAAVSSASPAGCGRAPGDAMGGELMGPKDALHRSQTHAARRLRQHPTGPNGWLLAAAQRAPKRPPAAPWPPEAAAAGFARLVARERFEAFGQ
jgi:hypothetical protein